LGFFCAFVIRAGKIIYGSRRAKPRFKTFKY